MADGFTWKFGLGSCDYLHDDKTLFTITMDGQGSGRWLGPYGHYYTDVTKAMQAAELHVHQLLLKEKQGANKCQNG